MKNELPTLYARTETGAIQTWKIEIEGNKFRSVSGQMDGKKIVNEWTIVEAKNVGRANATTGEEQAFKEAESKWKKKLKSGGYFKTVEEIDNSLSFVEPMLAHKLKDHPKKVQYPCMVDRKYNGGRVVATKSRLATRKGETYETIPHIFEALKSVFQKYPNLVLDGEGYNHEYRYKLNELMKILRTTKKEKITTKLLAESKEKVKYYVYDGYGFDNITESTGCEARRSALVKLLKDVPYIVVVPHVIANNEEEVKEHYQLFVDDGYEGAMVRNSNSKYEHKRSHNLLKVKPEDDSEAIIVKINEGVGNWKGTAATASMNWKGIEFDATFKGTIEQKTVIFKNQKDWLKKSVTFLYNGLTGKNVPNFARIDVDNCFQGNK
jgi:DNA ligase 1